MDNRGILHRRRLVDDDGYMRGTLIPAEGGYRLIPKGNLIASDTIRYQDGQLYIPYDEYEDFKDNNNLIEVIPDDVQKREADQ